MGFTCVVPPDALRFHLSERPYREGHLYGSSSSSHSPWRRSPVIRAFTHLHMLRRRTVLESPTVDLPQPDQNRLFVMSVGDNDLFGPDARKVHEWKRDTDEEKVKLISRVFDEREQRDKAKKKPSSSTSRPPCSLSHRSPLESFPSPRPKDSYKQQPG